MYENEFIARASILIVDDEALNRRLLERMLTRAGYRDITTLEDPLAVLEHWRQAPPDLALFDLHMPGVTGHELLERVRVDTPENAFIPIIMLTGDASPEAKQRALALGAHDFITKPFDSAEVMLRIRNLLRTRWLTVRLQETNAQLDQRVRERTAELESARVEALAHLARAAEFRDDITGHHTQRVGELAAAIAIALGWDASSVELLRRAAPLHDIGKIGIPDAILLKAGRLSDVEFAVMKTHTTIGARILANSRSPVFVLAEEIARTHHERWDGGGYPIGIAGSAIAMSGRIVAVADAFDALTHDRPYKPAVDHAAALAELIAEAGQQFDPVVVTALERALEHIPDSQLD